MATPRQSAVETYRYLRVGLVALAVLLAAAVVGQIVWGVGLLDSISAYYVTPARDIFVGVLFALGIALIAVRGRGVEDVLLNIAGMLAPIVAVVPVRETDLDSAYMGTQRLSAIPDAASARTLLVLGVIGVVFAAFTAARVDAAERRPAVLGVLASAAVVVGFGAWSLVDVDSFLAGAHYAAAIGLFAMFVVVAWLNAAWAADPDEGPVSQMLPAARRRHAYRVISVAMLLTLVTGAVLAVLDRSGTSPLPYWLFWVEAVLLALFAVFWVLQTIEHWRRGIPLATPAG